MPAALLLLASAIACNDDGATGGGPPAGSPAPARTSPVPSGGEAEILDEAKSAIADMIAAARQGDVQTAHEAFDDGHDALHDIIDALEATDPALAGSLDQAVDKTENDFEKDVDAAVIAEDGEQLAALLDQVNP